MSQRSHPRVSRASFSLAAGLEVAAGQRVLEAVGRAKLASVLFDEIVVESGLHIVQLSATEVASVERRPAATISPELLENSRTVQRGTKAGLAVRIGDQDIELYFGTNLPRFPDANYYERDVAFRYVCEYHTGLLDELAQLGADWVRVVEVVQPPGEDMTVTDCQLARLSPQETSDEPFATIHLAPEEARQLADELLPLEQHTGETSSREPRERQRKAETATAQPPKQMLAEDLAEAIHLADHLEAVPIMSSAFELVASERGVPVSIPGAESLGFVVPNLSGIPWEALAQFREHPGAVEARGRLREFEAEAAARELAGSAAFVRETAKAVSDGLLGVVKDLAPSLPEDLRSPILGSTVGVIPLVGQYASLAVSMGDAIAALRQHREFEGSWVAAIFQLRDAAVDTLVDW